MLPPDDDPKLRAICERVVTGYRLEHDPSFTIVHVLMLGLGGISRADYNKILRAYCRAFGENRNPTPGDPHALRD